MSVDVLQGGGKFEFAALDFRLDAFKSRNNCLSLVGSNQTYFGQHASMSLARLNVLPIKAPINADGFGELDDALVGVTLKSSAPGFLAHKPSSFNCFLYTSAGAP